uniref:Metal ABC transporter ATP-binding protein n=1 Tax=Fervidicoccus fontis TaxID=683846 RepID=A0A7J3ZK70_9CREN
MDEPSLSVESLTVRVGGQTVLKGLEFGVSGHGLLQVLGPNGAGKTTLLRAILGLIAPVEGRVLVSGVNATGRPDVAGRLMGYVPQHEGFEVGYPLTAWDVVEQEFLLKSSRWPRVSRDLDSTTAVSNALEMVGLDRGLWRRPVSNLSGGERQRVLIARALVCRPDILLLDEPLSPIDPKGRLELAELLGDFSRRLLLVVTSHDPGILLEQTRWVLLLNKEVFYFGSPGKALVEEILRRVYGLGSRVDSVLLLGSSGGSCRCA